MAKKPKRKQYEFRPDPKGTNFLKRLYMTRLQRRKFLKWGLYALTGVVLLLIQDVLMSQFRLHGATTDLAVCLILLVGIYEGMEDGGLFALITSALYWLSGSAPGPYVVAILPVMTVLICLFRQSFWRRSFGSVCLCTGIAVLAYEMCLLLIGIFQGLTIWSRVGVFLLTAAYTCIIMLPLYPLVSTIAKIGGETWKE